MITQGRYSRRGDVIVNYTEQRVRTGIDPGPVSEIHPDRLRIRNAFYLFWPLDGRQRRIGFRRTLIRNVFAGVYSGRAFTDYLTPEKPTWRLGQRLVGQMGQTGFEFTILMVRPPLGPIRSRSTYGVARVGLAELYGEI